MCFAPLPKSELHILATGKIVAAEVHWRIAPLPAEEFQADAAFDAPAHVSYFAHLFPAPGPRGTPAPPLGADDEQEWQDHFLDVEWLRQGC